MSEPSPDPVASWRDVVVRVSDLALSLSPEQVDRHVPACPDWTVKDLLAHMVGLGGDVLDGNEPDDHDETWTQAQVDDRAGRTVPELVAEWQALVPGLSAWMTEHGSRPLNDAVIHEQDLRGAVSQPGAGDTAGLGLVRDRLAERVGGRLGDLAPLALRGSGWTWASDGSVDEAAVMLEAPDLDLARALMGRRTASELRSYAVRGDVEPYLEAFAHLGPLPDEPLSGG